MKRKIISLIVSLLIYFMGQPAYVLSKELGDYQTGIFSDLKSDNRTGDISGAEIFIMHSKTLALGQVVLNRDYDVSSIVGFPYPDYLFNRHDRCGQ